jgi:hypothetical protein
MHAVMFAPLLRAAAEFWSLFRSLCGQRQSTRRDMIPVFAFAFERGFGLDSCASAFSELFVNLARGPWGPTNRMDRDTCISGNIVRRCRLPSRWVRSSLQI